MVIVEYLDDLAGGGKLIPASGAERWQVKTGNAIIQGMLDAMLLCRYESGVRPEAMRWPKWIDDQWDRILQGLKQFWGAAQVVFGFGIFWLLQM